MSARHPNLVRLLEPGLPDAERRQIESHVATCATCQAEWHQLRQTSGLLDTWHVTAPDGNAFVDRLLAATQAARDADPWTDRRAFALRIAAAVAIAGVTGVVIGLSVPPRPAVSIAPAESGQVVELLGLDSLSGDDLSALARLVEPDETPDLEEPS